MIRLIFSFSLILFSFALIIFSISLRSSAAILGAKSMILEEKNQTTTGQIQNTEVEDEVHETPEEMAYYRELLNIYKTPPSESFLEEQQKEITTLQSIAKKIRKILEFNNKDASDL